MDKGRNMTQTRWKKRLLWAAAWAAGIVLAAVLAGAFLFRHELKTLTTLKKIDDNVLYSMKYDGDMVLMISCSQAPAPMGSWLSL